MPSLMRRVFLLRTIYRLHAWEIHRALKQHRGDKLGAVNGAVNGAVKQVLQYIAETPGSRANAISAALNLPLLTTQRYLEQLKEQAKSNSAVPHAMEDTI